LKLFAFDRDITPPALSPSLLSPLPLSSHIPHTFQIVICGRDEEKMDKTSESLALTFEAQKERALVRLRIRGADEEIAPIINRINNFDDFFTMSSCSGRIVLISIPEIGAKREAKFIGKWHRSVTKEEVLAAIKLKWREEITKGREIWLLSQSPILHVACKDLEKAKALLRIAIESGFKYSGIKAISKDGKVVVEIVSTERMDVPLGKDGMLFCSEGYMDFITSKANFMLKKGKEKLKRLYYGLKVNGYAGRKVFRKKIINRF